MKKQLLILIAVFRSLSFGLCLINILGFNPLLEWTKIDNYFYSFPVNKWRDFFGENKEEFWSKFFYYRRSGVMFPRLDIHESTLINNSLFLMLMVLFETIMLFLLSKNEKDHKNKLNFKLVYVSRILRIENIFLLLISLFDIISKGASLNIIVLIFVTQIHQTALFVLMLSFFKKAQKIE